MTNPQNVESQQADEEYCAWANEMDRQMNDRVEHNYHITTDPVKYNPVCDF